MPQLFLTTVILLMALGSGLNLLRSGFFFLHLALVAGGSYSYALAMGDMPLFSMDAIAFFLLLHLPLINLVTFAVYAYDKRAARRGAWRIPEKQLHAFALLGGFPGAYIAQQKLRHKTRKASFKKQFWLLLAVEVILIASSLAMLVTMG